MISASLEKARELGVAVSTTIVDAEGNSQNSGLGVQYGSDLVLSLTAARLGRRRFLPG